MCTTGADESPEEAGNRWRRDDLADLDGFDGCDLDDLTGTWSESEAARFGEALRAQRQVDARLWR